MILTRSGESAIRALIYIAEQSDDRYFSTPEIAEAIGAPRNYLSKLLHQLAQAGLLDSERGPHGGFALAVAPDSFTLAEALAPIEPDRLERGCLLGRARCTDEDPCPIHAEWKDLREHISSFLEETTIFDLSQVDPHGGKT